MTSNLFVRSRRCGVFDVLPAHDTNSDACARILDSAFLCCLPVPLIYQKQTSIPVSIYLNNNRYPIYCCFAPPPPLLGSELLPALNADATFSHHHAWLRFLPSTLSCRRSPPQWVQRSPQTSPPTCALATRCPRRFSWRIGGICYIMVLFLKLTSPPTDERKCLRNDKRSVGNHTEAAPCCLSPKTNSLYTRPQPVEHCVSAFAS